MLRAAIAAHTVRSSQGVPEIFRNEKAGDNCGPFVSSSIANAPRDGVVLSPNAECRPQPVFRYLLISLPRYSTVAAMQSSPRTPTESSRRGTEGRNECTATQRLRWLENRFISFSRPTGSTRSPGFWLGLRPASTSSTTRRYGAAKTALIDISLTVSPIFDAGGRVIGASKISRDISDLKREQERSRVTLASIGDGVISTDAIGRVVFMNSAAEHITGWQQGEAVGQDLEAVFKIFNETSRRPVESPVRIVLREGRTHRTGFTAPPDPRSPREFVDSFAQPGGRSRRLRAEKGRSRRRDARQFRLICASQG